MEAEAQLKKLPTGAGRPSRSRPTASGRECSRFWRALAHARSHQLRSALRGEFAASARYAQLAKRLWLTRTWRASQVLPTPEIVPAPKSVSTPEVQIVPSPD